MKLKRFLLRYYPPGIILEYEKGGEMKTKSIDLLDLTPSTDIDTLVEEIRRAEPLVTVSRIQQVKYLIVRLQEKLSQQDDHKFYLFKVRIAFKITHLLKCSLLPSLAVLRAACTSAEIPVICSETLVAGCSEEVLCRVLDCVC
ncbi:dynein assembly factor with WDR repeat domains 1-like [Microcaecilia unicolor]|uniref:Dynein assembly factor with WDR repeat domains 1-like n=1 Tax=Microcaecilia unicolor TaxID=1415580 RepID=A0A6P7YWL7_9AMPH|nr:dynein assembly factor with WDR repeat domains 1-like [Microcaecilia unicolor]